MNKIISFIKKHWFIITAILLCIIRFLFTYKLPNFYLTNLNYDDDLTINQFLSLTSKDYLGDYSHKTLIKGPIFIFLIFLIRLYKLNYSSVFTVLYILAVIYFVYSLKDIVKNKKYLILIIIILLFNPVTYSQDLFQRLYRNSLSIIEFLFFLGSIIRVLFYKNKKLYHYILFGLCLSLMFLTREDNIWTYPIIGFIIIYNFIKTKKLKVLVYNLVPIFILVLSLNIMSYINYKNYGIYSYNEIQKSEFHNTYKKILEIKDSTKISQVSIPKSTIYKLAEYSKTFDFTKEEIDNFYKKYAGSNGEIYNGNIVWYFRLLVYNKYKFKSGKDSELYYKKLGDEIDKLFKSGKLEKEFTMPSTSLAVPTKKDIEKVPGQVLNAVGYTTTYKNIKTLTDTKKYKFDLIVDAYYFKYTNYHYTVDIVKHNKIQYEIIRLVYKWLTIIFSIISLFIYFKNVRKLDTISIISHVLLVSYLLIIGGVVYTHITSFHAIRPLYLGNIYIIQNIFILLNMYRLKCKVK